LFREPSEYVIWNLETSGHLVSTAFGQLSWGRVEGGTINVQFFQNDAESLERTRMPFGELSYLIDKGTIISRYQVTLFEASGCSDGTLAWPDAQSPLVVRIAALRLNIARLQAWKHRHDESYFQKEQAYNKAQLLWEPGHPRPVRPQQSKDGRALILSAKWLEEASRVARRATTGGGDDRALLEDCLDTLRIQNPLLSDEALDKAIQAITHGFMFREHSYIAKRARNRDEPAVTTRSNVRRNRVYDPEVVKNAVEDAFEKTLQGYANTRNEWKKELYDARVDLKWLLRSEHTITFDSDVVRFIHSETMPGSDLWKSTVFLQ